ncbi:hypothetical protein [Bradyrhizobium sp. B120]|uniref:hypothetical protein n=1 Tax=Bradyrhizobium sp. B120 TaxID=3410088 RepID=UPI003B9836B4
MNSRFPSAFALLRQAVILGTLSSAGISSALAAGAPLVVEKDHRVAAAKDSRLILVLDLKPNLVDLQKSGAEASDLIRATAARYAKDYLAQPEFSSSPKVVVYLISVDSMDEYNRAKFDGMRRFGTIAFEKKGDEVVLTEDKLSFSP